VQELVLIFTDLFIAAGASSPQSVPPLPALSALLARGSVHEEADWRRWALRTYAGVQVERVPVAAVSRRALSEDPATVVHNAWMATPVHLDAGLTDVHMSEHLPELDQDEQRTLTADFNRQFAADGWQLEFLSAKAALLSTAASLEADTVDPARLLTQSIGAALPSGPGSSQLRRVMTEVQMWLHGHALNEARERRGAPSVNSLWIWGGGVEPAVQPSRNLPHLMSDDAFLLGLWRMLHARSVPAPAASLAALRARESESSVAALSRVGDSHSPAQALEAIERDWTAPALQALKNGDVQRVRLHVNDRLFTTTRRDLLRFWRAPRSWLEQVA